MPSIADLIPELRLWNEGKEIAPGEWIWIEGRADHALGYCSLVWPELLAFEGYVLRGPVDLERLRGWEAGQASPQQIETAMNVLFLDGAFQTDQADDEIKDAQLTRLADMMTDMLEAKLKRDFPDRAFSVFIINDEDDFGVSFHQIR